jgi:hypothetical protein
MSFIKTLKKKKKRFFCILKVTEDFGTDPDPLVRGTDQRKRNRIRIRTKMSRIRNTAYYKNYSTQSFFGVRLVLSAVSKIIGTTYSV